MSSLLKLGIICTPEEYARSLQDPLFHCLTRTETIGLIVKTEAAVLSLISVLHVLFLVLRNVIWRIRHLSKDRLRIFHQPMDLFMCSLFLAEFLQAIGYILSINWIKDGKVEVGTICDAQGILTSVGEAIVAMTTVIIAVYTFIGMWTMKSLSSLKTALGVVCGIWCFVGLLAIMGIVRIHNSSDDRFATPTPLWCWINGTQHWWRLVGVYIWTWLSLLCSVLLYALLYLWMRGNITIDEWKWWKFSFRRTGTSDPVFDRLRQRSSIMLAYPLANSVAYLPISNLRWNNARLGQHYISPTAWSFFAISFLALSGFINVVLLLSTRPESGLFGQLMFRHPGMPLLLTSEPSALEGVEPQSSELQNSQNSQNL